MTKGVDYPGITVVFFCHDGAGKYLVGKRSQKCRDEHGTWDPGGGGLELGETLEMGVTREVEEEYGAKPLVIEYLGHREVHREHLGVKTHWIAFDFKVQVSPRDVRIMEPDMMDEVRWVHPEEVPQPTHSQFPKFLQKYRERFI